MLKGSFRTLLMLICTFGFLLAASLEVKAAGSPDYYLIIVIDANKPSERGWAEPIVITHDRPGKTVIADALDCNALYNTLGKKVKLGEVYSLGGEKLLISVINSSLGLNIKSYAKTTYAGLDAIARIMGRSLDISSMIEASKSSDRGAVRREQLKFIDAVAYGLHNLSITKLYQLFTAAFKHVDTNLSIWQSFNLARDIMGGTFIPSDGRELGVQL